jgi:iron complex outermembrane receptor protein
LKSIYHKKQLICMKTNSNALKNRLLLGLVFLLFGIGSSFAQRSISGTVIDAENDEPLIGANILIKGTSSGTITDLDGNYTLDVQEGDVLVFSYTGYSAQEVAVSGQSRIDISLSAGELLEEIVVVGYGTVKKKDLTGSVASVKEEDFNRGVVTAPDQLIQGKVSGVQILNNSGQPGGATTVRVRGNSSVRAGGSPLFVVDGVPIFGSDPRPHLDGDDVDIGDSPAANGLNFINPNDIASIEVLKDASATAIYGSRGSNGVVLITTKKGKSGDPTIEFNVSTGISNILKEYDILTGDEYRSALSEYGLTGGNEGGSVDAMDEILRTGVTQNYNFSIGGGSENGTYRVSASYLDQEGIIVGSALKKYTGNISGTYKFLDSKRLRVDFNLLASQNTEDIAPVGSNAGFTGSVVGQALQWNPTLRVRNTDGTPYVIEGSTTINPVGMLEAHDDVFNQTVVFGGISPSYEIVDGLTYKYLYSIGHGVGERRTQVKGFLNLQDVEGRGFARVAENASTIQNHQHTLSYIKDLSSDLSLNAVIGYEYQKDNATGFSMSVSDFITDDIDFTHALQNSSQSSRRVSSFADPINELQSYFGRANLNFKDKYLFTATFRADGSSKFGENNKYGYFPSFAAAWKITNEEFMTGGIFDDLKLRLGWGQTGNQEFPSGASQERFSLGDNGTFSPENVANPDLQWETSTTINAGIDFALFDYKLSGTVEYFHK